MSMSECRSRCLCRNSEMVVGSSKGNCGMFNGIVVMGKPGSQCGPERRRIAQMKRHPGFRRYPERVEESLIAKGAFYAGFEGLDSMAHGERGETLTLLGGVASPLSNQEISVADPPCRSATLTGWFFLIAFDFAYSSNTSGSRLDPPPSPLLVLSRLHVFPPQVQDVSAGVSKLLPTRAST
ncbi:hypothetical protein BX600DRAFT_471793 [Xylariales sp. PMI_506]|nr:hypothetical protein BX600DRAFT_471793 [Xylariales sp. PMI_506]